MATTAKIWHAQFVDSSGNPVSGVKVYHYTSGTTSNKDVYRDAGKTTVDTQPVQGDTTGFVKFYGDGTYRLRVVNNDNILLYDLDPVEITGSTTGTDGRILFYGSSGSITDDDDLTWDSVNKRAAFGTTTNITEQITMGAGGFLGVPRTGASSNEGAKRLIGLNSSNKVSIDQHGMGTVFETLPTKGILYLDANGQIQVFTLTNGQFIIGSNGAVPVATGINAGFGITVLQGDGTCTISSSGMTVVDKNGTANNVTNTTTETDLYSVTVPASVMGTHGGVTYRVAGQYVNNTGGPVTGVLKVKFGGATVFQDTTPSLGASASNRAWQMEVSVQNTGATNSQQVNGRFTMGVVSSAAAGTGDLASLDEVNCSFATSASIDTTQSQVITASWTHSAASANLTMGKLMGHAFIF